VLSVLVTYPDRQKRGAGSALVKWGCDLADKENLPAYLEATPAGYAVYKKNGFEDIDAITFDFKPFSDRDGSIKITNMIRQPRTS